MVASVASKDGVCLSKGRSNGEELENEQQHYDRLGYLAEGRWLLLNTELLKLNLGGRILVRVFSHAS